MCSPHRPPEPRREEHIAVVVDDHALVTAHTAFLHGEHEGVAVCQLRRHAVFVHPGDVLSSDIRPKAWIRAGSVGRKTISLFLSLSFRSYIFHSHAAIVAERVACHRRIR